MRRGISLTVPQNKPSQPDVFSFILEDYDAIENPTKDDYMRLCGDAHLIAVAGR